MSTATTTTNHPCNIGGMQTHQLIALALALAMFLTAVTAAHRHTAAQRASEAERRSRQRICAELARQVARGEDRWWLT